MVAHILTDNTHSTRQRARHLPGRCRRRCCGWSRAAATRAKYPAPPAFPLTSGPVLDEASVHPQQPRPRPQLDPPPAHLQPDFPHPSLSDRLRVSLPLGPPEDLLRLRSPSCRPQPCGRACSATALRLPSRCAQPLLLGLLSCAAPSSLCTRGRLHAHVRPGRCLGTYGPRVQTRPCTEWCAPYRAYAPYRRERTRAAQWAARSGTYA